MFLLLASVCFHLFSRVPLLDQQADSALLLLVTSIALLRCPELVFLNCEDFRSLICSYWLVETCGSAIGSALPRYRAPRAVYAWRRDRKAHASTLHLATEISFNNDIAYDTMGARSKAMTSKSNEQHFKMTINQDDVTVEAVRMQATFTRSPTTLFMRSKSWRACQSSSTVPVPHRRAHRRGVVRGRI